jgi:hypothetical protein
MDEQDPLSYFCPRRVPRRFVDPSDVLLAAPVCRARVRQNASKRHPHHNVGEAPGL